MRKVFVALAFVAIIVSASLLPEAKNQISNSLSKLQMSKMGKNIITAIQLEMTSKNKENIVVRILALLNELLSQQVASEATAQDELTKKVDYCGETTADYEGQVSSKQGEISGAETSVPVFESQIESDQNAKVDQENKRDNANQSLEEEHEDNRQATAAFDKSTRNHNAMVEALNNARTLIVQLSSNSFLQKNNAILAQIQNHNQVSMKALSEHSNKAIFALLMQMAQDVGIQANQQLVGDVVNVIDDLLKYEQETAALEVFNDGERVTRYNQRVVDLSENFRVATEEVARLENQINTNVHDLNAAKNNIVQWNQQLAELNDLLQQHNEQCVADVNNFHQQIEDLNNEIDIIREVIAIFEGQAISDIQPLVDNLEF